MTDIAYILEYQNITVRSFGFTCKVYEYLEFVIESSRNILHKFNIDLITELLIEAVAICLVFRRVLIKSAFSWACLSTLSCGRHIFE